jgi:hypothetical protein
MSPPQQVILDALRDLFRIVPGADVSLNYDFSHSFLVSMDTTRFNRVFSSPEDFFERIQNEADFLKTVDVVVSDFHFDRRSKLDGFSFAQKFKEISDLPMLLASDGEFHETEWRQLFRAVLKKHIYSAGELRTLLNSTGVFV